MESPPLFDRAGRGRTARLRLEPVSAENAAELWLVHSDDEVWPWYGSVQPTREQILRRADSLGESWRFHGVHKWIAYDIANGEVVGRGGLSRVPINEDWGQLYEFLPARQWVRRPYEVQRPYLAHANWLEIGWALRRTCWGRGYAAELGRAGLTFAFDVLGMRAVVSCAARHNVRSRAVMERIGLRYAGEIRTRGIAEGVEGEREDAPFAVYLLLRADWERFGESG